MGGRSHGQGRWVYSGVLKDEVRHVIIIIERERKGKPCAPVDLHMTSEKGQKKGQQCARYAVTLNTITPPNFQCNITMN